MTQWLTWAAENLAYGISEKKIRSAIACEIGEDAARRVMEEALSNKLFEALKNTSRRLKHVNTLNEVLCELETLSDKKLEISRVSNLSSSRFLREFYSKNKPLIITDIVHTWPAYKKWNKQYLIENFGDERITYQFGRLNSDHRDSFVDHSKKGTVKQFFSEMLEQKDNFLVPYIIAHDRVLDNSGLKILRADILFDDRYFDKSKEPGRSFLWVGPESASTPMHRDLGNVYLAQIKGRKHVKLVPSRQIHLIYNEAGYHSEIDFQNIDFTEFPLAKKLSIYETVVQPGELLFIPVGWWHDITSLDFTISVTGNNFKFKNSFTPIF